MWSQVTHHKKEHIITNDTPYESKKHMITCNILWEQGTHETGNIW